MLSFLLFKISFAVYRQIKKQNVQKMYRFYISFMQIDYNKANILKKES